ncbi:MAG: fibronectin type III domain-containing protein, partial [Gemmatimonadaceae bacterium]|nr:fibronectin type III domain-containing protein [Gemmatimonadaceae bacterium]
MSATALSPSRIDVSWSDVTGETSYEVQVQGGQWPSFVPLTTLAANVTAYSHSDAVNLAPGTQYCYRVRAVNATGPSPWSTTPCATTLTVGTVPPTPVGVSATALSVSRIDVGWSDVTGETSYEVQVQGGQWPSFVPLTTLAANVTVYSHSDAVNLAPGTQYCYRVRAVNATGPSAWSTTRCATTLGGIPAVPGNVVAVATSSSAIDVSWSDVTGETSYEVQVQGGQWPSFVPLTTLAANVTAYSHSDAVNLAPGTQYCYRVRAVSAAGPSAWSTTPCATTLGGIPAVPGNVVAVATSSSAIDVSWSDVTGETSYEVQVQGGQWPSFVALTTLGANVTAYSHSDAVNLAPGTQYCYRVRAVSGAGPSAWSTTPCATTLGGIPAVPGNVVAAAMSSSRIDVSWSDVTGETSYEVQVQGGQWPSFVPLTTLAANVTAYSHSDAVNLSPGTQYCYRVRAVSAAGPSAWSTTPCATTPGGIPAVPGNVVAVATSSSDIDVRWSDVANETSYELEWATTSSG